jgi:hypothetical protein
MYGMKNGSTVPLKVGTGTLINEPNRPRCLSKERAAKFSLSRLMNLVNLVGGSVHCLVHSFSSVLVFFLSLQSLFFKKNAIIAVKSTSEVETSGLSLVYLK